MTPPREIGSIGIRMPRDVREPGDQGVASGGERVSECMRLRCAFRQSSSAYAVVVFVDRVPSGRSSS